jgi:N-carbamoylputrescine amidase
VTGAGRPGSVRVAVAQLDLPPLAFDANRRRCVAAIGEAARRRADLVVLPELASSGYRLRTPHAVAAAAEPIPGPTTAAWRDAAAAAGCIVVGGVCERDGDRLYNSAVVVGAAGVLGIYRKLHLFDEEQLLFAPGDAGLPVLDLPAGRLGVLVCYDLRFVEALRILALQGADIVAVPTAWVGGFDHMSASGEMIEQVRSAAVQANLNGVYVAAASRTGADDGLAYLGSSCVIDPYGDFVLEPMTAGEERLAVVDVDLGAARRAKVRAPRIRPLADRRTDVYDALLGYSPPQAVPADDRAVEGAA